MSIEKEDDILYQVGFKDALLGGYYNGIVSVDTLLEHGDTGVGTFEGLDGEMTILDSVIYQSKGDGENIVNAHGKTPFACVKKFKCDIIIEEISKIRNLEELEGMLNNKIESGASKFNCMYVAKLKGELNNIRLRSGPIQQKPYKPLVEADKSHTEFVYNDVTGTLVAFFCPKFVSSLNNAGWHFHFISDDKTKGGHVLELDIEKCSGELDASNSFSLLIPKGDEFSKFSF